MDEIYDDNRIEQIANEYAEPGYSTDKIILTANWNNFTSDEMEKIESEYEIEWSDEWTTCQDCARLVRTSPDCYFWQKSYVIFDNCELLCLDCLEDYMEEYLEDYINNPNKALTGTLTDKYPLTNYGFTLHDSGFENGLHKHMNDNPQQIFKDIKIKYPNHDIVFVISDVSQFYITFDVYIRQ